ncbi:MAG: cbb3-type cytochrome oxidase assembly protein CcoS [Rhodocyclales bacterium]|nr:cbb3-type cytochrome oxidase assembly protein CcoS [Rhodocyclales bacterium]
MDILYLLIPLSLVLVFVIAIFFWWSLRSNQYDDLDGPGYRILMDDDRNPPNGEATDNSNGSPASPNRCGAKLK